MTMQKLEAGDAATESADVVADNIEKLKALFPELITEGKDGASINVDVLKQLVGDQTLTDADEKYGLNWFGKRRARQLALTPSTGTLRPCPEDSVDWDTTQNLMVEGDNLEVLKLLQKSYAGKVKLIYIDPPYNTGKDFVYPDNYQDSIRNYMELTGQVEGGAKISSNTEASGRFHTDWLNMMYPRLKLAKSLLRQDGVIVASLDDTEIENFRSIMRELFGDANFIAQIIWKKRSTPPNDKIIGANHDYIAIFSTSSDAVKINLRARTKQQLERYANPDNHPKGPWVPGDLMANIKGGRYVASLDFEIVNPVTGKHHHPSETARGNWRFSERTVQDLLAKDEIYFGETGDGRPKLKRFLCDVKNGITYPTIWDFVPFNTDGSAEMQALFGDASAFPSPKPVGLIHEVVKLATKSGDSVLDFFAGSGTTGHAVMAQNAADGGTRKYILVQLPEPLDPENKDQKAAADFCDQLGKPRTIAELTKERLRRAGAKVKADNSDWHGDTGFRVFKLDSSNIRAWRPQPEDLGKALAESVEHLSPERTEADVLYELLLKLGLDLCMPIETREIAREGANNANDSDAREAAKNAKKSQDPGKTLRTFASSRDPLVVHSVGGGTLIACLAEKIADKDVEALAQGIVAWHEEQKPAGDITCVFRDSAFADDVAKTNLAAILEQHGLANVRSL